MKLNNFAKKFKGKIKASYHFFVYDIDLEENNFDL